MGFESLPGSATGASIALADLIPALACPHCGGPLEPAGPALRCPSGHAFDVARQGYVNLRAGDSRAGTADSRGMVAARAAFLDAGHYHRIAAAIVEALLGVRAPGIVVDAGSGPGHHLAAALDAVPDRFGLAVDVSVHAARRAARVHPRAAAVVADVWRGLPVREGAAAAVLHVFAPRNGAEAARILAPGGVAIVVTPERGHLSGLRERLGLLAVDDRKQERLEAALGPHLAKTADERVAYDLALDRDAALALALMGPSGHHLDAADVLARLAAEDESLRVPVAVRVSVWTRSQKRIGS